MLRQRIITAVLGIPIIFLIFYLGGSLLLAVSSLIVFAGMIEFYRMAKGMDLHPLVGWGYVIGLICISFGIYFKEGKYLPYMLFVLIFLSIFHFLISFPKWSLNDLSVTYFGAFYIGGLFSYLIRIRETIPNGMSWIVFVFILTWANDTGAYFIGTKFGKNPLAPNLSPKKSIEGFVGGLACTSMIAIILGYFYGTENYFAWLALGILVSLVGALGDLLASAFKRLGKVKDSGTLIPGHGGVLDRLDSLLLVAPLVYYYLELFKL